MNFSETVPAYRLAVFRTAIGAVTLLAHLPRFERFLNHYSASSFHVPMLPWVPPLCVGMVPLLIVLRRLAGWGLFLGFFPRISAAFLAVSGFYILSLDIQHYRNNALFHIILLALLACVNARVYLIRWQLSIVLFYSALDKVFSPYWAQGGGVGLRRCG